MYRVNDVLIEGHIIQNVFNTADHEFHSKFTKPIGGFWTLSKVLELEFLMDETLDKFVDILCKRFVDGDKAGTVCMMDDWLTYCMMLSNKTHMLHLVD